MIISRTPVRVSFCGGGTDLPAYYLGSENGGLVTSFALSKHIHVTVNKRFDDSVRVGYSRTEIVDNFENIEHELVREAMRMTGVTSGIEITTIADIPSRGTGLGSSSTLTVGLLNALHTFAGKNPTAAQLAAHVAMSVGHPAMHIDQHALLPMTVTHAIAIPVSALLIVVAAGLLAALTSTIRAITVISVIASHTVAAISREMFRSGGALVIGGCGVRAPPGRS